MFFATGVVLVLCSVYAFHHASQQLFSHQPIGKLSKSVGFFGQRIHVYCTPLQQEPNEHPVVIFHHDFAGSSLDFAQLQDELWKEHSVSSCSYDRPGYGFSPAPEANQAIKLSQDTAQYMDAVRQFISLDNVVHVGHGVGALFAWTAADKKSTKGLFFIEALDVGLFASR